MKTERLFGQDKRHLSFSAINLWKKNKAQYRKKYYDGEPSISTVYTTFGNVVHKLVEENDFGKYPVLKEIPIYSKHEEPIEIEIEGVPIRGFLDLYEPDNYSFADLKSGIVHKTNGPPWTALKVRQWEQLPFYSLLVKKKFGKVQNKCHLIWLETYFEESKQKSISPALKVGRGELQLTGQIKIFPRVIAEWERKRMQDDIIKTAAEIQEDYAAYIKSY